MEISTRPIASLASYAIHETTAFTDLDKIADNMGVTDWFDTIGSGLKPFSFTHAEALATGPTAQRLRYRGSGKKPLPRPKIVWHPFFGRE